MYVLFMCAHQTVVLYSNVERGSGHLGYPSHESSGSYPDAIILSMHILLFYSLVLFCFFMIHPRFCICRHMCSHCHLLGRVVECCYYIR